jgi:hypothetical protein
MVALLVKWKDDATGEGAVAFTRGRRERSWQKLARFPVDCRTFD